MKRHPNDLRLEGLYLAQAGEDRDLLVHLVGCPRCRDRFAALARDRPAPAAAGAEDEPAPVHGRLFPFALALARERLDAPDLFLEIAWQTPERQEALLREPRFHTWGLFELLVERSLEAATRDTVEAEGLGRLALHLSGHLDAAVYGPPLIEDLRARAWGHVGNARRVRSDLPGAGEAFAAARAHLRLGTREPLERAILLDLEASLSRDQRRFDDALRLLRRAVNLFEENGESHRAGRSLVNLSTVHYFMGDIGQALEELREALHHLEAEQEPRLFLCARHNLAFYLTEAGQFAAAQAAYRDTRPLYRDFAEPWVQNRRKWVRGRILRGLGHPALAESLWLAARDGFLAEGISYDTALVSLELASLYAEQGRTAELERLAAEMVPVFAALQIHREALAALAFLRQAIAAERAGVEVVAAIADFVRRARHQPELRFQAPQ